MSVKDELIEILESYGYPVRLQGSLGPTEAYPPSFFTFWNNQGYDANHYDNDAVAWIWDFEINFYSDSATLVNEVLPEVIKAFKTAGWVTSGRGHDSASDEITHTGRGFRVLKRENNNFLETEEEDPEELDTPPDPEETEEGDLNNAEQSTPGNS